MEIISNKEVESIIERNINIKVRGTKLEIQQLINGISYESFSVFRKQLIDEIIKQLEV